MHVFGPNWMQFLAKSMTTAGFSLVEFVNAMCLWLLSNPAFGSESAEQNSERVTFFAFNV